MQKRSMAPSPARLGAPGPCTAVVPPPKATLRARWNVALVQSLPRSSCGALWDRL